MAALNQHLFSSPKHNWSFNCSRDFASPSKHHTPQHAPPSSASPSHPSTLKLLPLPPLANYITLAIAAAASFDGTKHECFLCIPIFATLGGLNAHIHSAAHDDDDGCLKCKRKDRLISSFVYHLKSRACRFARPALISDTSHI
ncbi:hypothetical protein BDN70DRAFT_934509 [Pholiota conissans]|uniref:C2H2-type domain-containing protein n=1 Tax=Pholiota conissans TaxID=109636 RepID=A0A9P5Z090_9AGAR|nr:hypothetical protein BDN70DRAFT_934509 [Pholiota conissans]